MLAILKIYRLTRNKICILLNYVNVEENKEVRNSVEKSYSWPTRARNPHGKLDITSLWEPLKH